MPLAAETSPAVPGISGRRLTLWVLVGLILIGLGISYTLWTYNQLDVARKQTAASWRDLTDQLSDRYREAGKLLLLQADEQKLDASFSQEFNVAIDHFRTTSLPKEQNAAALHVEQLIASAFASELSQPPELQMAVAAFNQSLERERNLLRSFGGRILDVFLNLSEPTAFELASVKDN
jgi:hypothetical protein